MNKTMLKILAIGLLAFLSNCASAYKMPNEKEPSAEVKIKIKYNASEARKNIDITGKNAYIAVNAFVKENKDFFALLSKTYPLDTGSQETVAEIKLHPDRPVALSIYLAAKWQTTSRKKVEEREPKSRQVGKNVYDLQKKQMVYKTETEYYTESKWVDKDVTEDHQKGCGANSIRFQPQKDAVYLVDYDNQLINNGCTINVYQQIPQADGSFKLVPVEESK